MLPNLFLADQIIFWMASIHKQGGMCTEKSDPFICIHHLQYQGETTCCHIIPQPITEAGQMCWRMNTQVVVRFYQASALKPLYVLQTGILYPSSNGTKSGPSGHEVYFNISFRDWHFVLCFQMFSQKASLQLTQAEPIAFGLSRREEWCGSVGSREGGSVLRQQQVQLRQLPCCC